MFSYCEQIWTRAKIHVRSFTSSLRFEFRANYPNMSKLLSLSLEILRIVVLVKNCLQEICKIVQSSFDGVRHIVGILCRKLLTLKSTSCRPHSSISAQTLYVISIIYRLPVLQTWKKSEVKWFFALFFLSSVTGDRYWPLSSAICNILLWRRANFWTVNFWNLLRCLIYFLLKCCTCPPTKFEFLQQQSTVYNSCFWLLDALNVSNIY